VTFPFLSRREVIDFSSSVVVLEVVLESPLSLAFQFVQVLSVFLVDLVAVVIVMFWVVLLLRGLVAFPTIPSMSVYCSVSQTVINNWLLLVGWIL
jgi:hypothetical protein